MGKRDANYYSILENSVDDMPPKIKIKKNKSKNLDFPELISPPSSPINSPKFITISSTVENKSLRAYNPFLLKKAVDSVSTSYTQSSFLKDGSPLLLCNNKAVAEKFIKCTSLANTIPIKAQLHKSLNSSKGLIYNRNLLNLSPQDIVAGLKAYNVTDAYFLEKTSDGVAKANGLILLTFDNLTAPKEIKVGFEVHKVREFVPRPMKCFKCHQLGHTAKFCKRTDTLCKVCALPLHGETLCTRKYCVNCVCESHSSSDSNCPKYLEAAEITKIQYQKKCSRYDAKKLYHQLNPNASSNSLSFSNLLSSSSALSSAANSLSKSSSPPSLSQTTPSPVSSSSQIVNLDAVSSSPLNNSRPSDKASYSNPVGTPSSNDINSSSSSLPTYTLATTPNNPSPFPSSSNTAPSSHMEFSSLFTTSNCSRIPLASSCPPALSRNPPHMQSSACLNSTPPHNVST